MNGRETCSTILTNVPTDERAWQKSLVTTHGQKSITLRLMYSDGSWPATALENVTLKPISDDHAVAHTILRTIFRRLCGEQFNDASLLVFDAKRVEDWMPFCFMHPDEADLIERMEVLGQVRKEWEEKFKELDRSNAPKLSKEGQLDLLMHEYCAFEQRLLLEKTGKIAPGTKGMSAGKESTRSMFPSSL